MKGTEAYNKRFQKKNSVFEKKLRAKQEPQISDKVRDLEFKMMVAYYESVFIKIK